MKSSVDLQLVEYFYSIHLQNVNTIIKFYNLVLTLHMRISMKNFFFGHCCISNSYYTFSSPLKNKRPGFGEKWANIHREMKWPKIVYSYSVTSLTTIKLNFSENLDMLRKQFGERFCSPKSRLESQIADSLNRNACSDKWCSFLRHVANASFLMITSSNKNL
jgi:hypothetical protein